MEWSEIFHDITERHDFKEMHDFLEKNIQHKPFIQIETIFIKPLI